MIHRKTMIPIYILVFLAFTNITLVTNQSYGINLMPICFVLAVGTLVAEAVKDKSLKLPNLLPGETYLIWLFLLTYLTFGLVKADLTVAFGSAIYPLLMNFFIFLLLTVVVKNIREAEFLLLTIALAAPVMFMQGVYAYVTQLMTAGLYDDVRATGWWQDPNTFAMIFNLSYLVSFYLMKKPQKVMCWAGRVAQLTSTLGVLITLSRGGIVIFLLITLMNLKVFWRYRSYYAGLTGFIVVFGLLISQTLNLDILSRINIDRLFMNAAYHGDYSNGRLTAAMAGLATYVRHPLAGVGFGNVLKYVEAYSGIKMYTHNMFIELLATGGTLPFLAYVIMLGRLFYIARSRLRGENRELGRLLSQYIIVLAGTGFFAHYLLYLKPVWVLIALYPILAQAKEVDQSEPDDHHSPLQSLHRRG